MLTVTVSALVLLLIARATVVAWHASGKFEWPKRAAAVMAPGLLGIVTFALATRILLAGTNMWNGARLAPAAALLRGYPLYPKTDDGPVTGHIYGPISPLCYLPAASLQDPTTALVAASFSSVVFFFGPVVVLLRYALAAGETRSDTSTVVYLSCFVALVTLTCPALRYVAFSVHCDAPALGLATLAIVALCFWRNRPLAFASSAAFATLAFWCKVTLVGLLPALFVSTLLVDGLRASFRYAVWALASVAVITAAILFVFGPGEVVFNVFVLPAAHPWGGLVKWEPGGILRDFYPDSLALRAKWFLIAAADYCETSAVIAVALPCSAYLHLTGRAGCTRNRNLSALTTSLFLTFLANLPISLAAKAKVGGDVNAYAYSLFFALLLTAVWLGISLGGVTGSRTAWIPGMAFMLTASIISWAVCSAGPGAIRLAYRLAARDDVATSHNVQAYRYAATHPGEAYFPWYPLAGLLAEGQLYHFSYGVFDRDLAGRRVREDHFLRHIPPNPKYVCFDDASNPFVNEYVLSYLRNYHPIPAPPELSGWHVYARD